MSMIIAVTSDLFNYECRIESAMLDAKVVHRPAGEVHQYKLRRGLANIFWQFENPPAGLSTCHSTVRMRKYPGNSKARLPARKN